MWSSVSGACLCLSCCGYLFVFFLCSPHQLSLVLRLLLCLLSPPGTMPSVVWGRVLHMSTCASPLVDAPLYVRGAVCSDLVQFLSQGFMRFAVGAARKKHVSRDSRVLQGIGVQNSRFATCAVRMNIRVSRFARLYVPAVRCHNRTV